MSAPEVLGILNLFQISVYSLHLLFTMNSVINPFIYGWMSKDFKTAFRKILRIHEKSGARGETDGGSTSDAQTNTGRAAKGITSTTKVSSVA